MQSTSLSQKLFGFLVVGTFICCSNQPDLGQSQPPSQGATSPCRPVPQLGRPEGSPYAATSPTQGRDGDCEASDNTQHSKPGSVKAQSNIKIFDASNRLDVLTSDQPLALAEPSQIPLRILTTGLDSLFLSQSQYFGYSPDFVYGSQQTEQIHYYPNGNPYITVVPMRLGKVELDVIGRFSDGGICKKKVALNIVPSQKSPNRLMVGHIGTQPDRNALRVLMAMSGDRSRDWLNVYAVYDGIATPVSINADFATFKINSGNQTDPIQLDQTGRLTPIHTGEALIETSFGGRTNLTCVVVEETIIPDRSYFNKNCKQLLSMGEKLGTVE
jgi:hypothetical protein